MKPMPSLSSGERACRGGWCRWRRSPRRCRSVVTPSHRPRPARARRARGLLVGVDQAGRRRAARQQLRMGAAVGDSAVLEVDDLVGQPDGGLAVGDHDQGRSTRAAPQGAEDPGLDLGVDRRGRVVEDQQPRAADQRPGQRDALPLASGQRGAAFAEPGVEALGQRGHEAVGLCGAQRRPDLRVADVGAERDVAADGVVEEEGRLRDHGHRPRPARRGARSRRSRPSTRIRPRSGSTSRVSSVVSVLLPEAVAPTTATVRPGSTVKVRSASTVWSGS